MNFELVGNHTYVPRSRSRANQNGTLEDHSEQAGHVPVMLTEVLAALQPTPGMTIVDGTLGGGGHARVIIELIQPGGRLFAFDRDVAAEARADALAADFPGSVTFVHASYASMHDRLMGMDLDGIDGVLLDLGLSSLQLADAERGFAFGTNGPLDMRFDQTRGESAAELIARADEAELADIIWRYGEERNSRRIARAIVRERQASPITGTQQLAELVSRAVGGRRGAPTHPATRTFQALRIAVNDELGELERGLQAGVESLTAGGRFVVIAFHSLEDRMVKQFFAQEARGCICPPELPVCVCGVQPRLRLVGRAVRATPSEVAANPRSRSAVLRVAERLP